MFYKGLPQADVTLLSLLAVSYGVGLNGDHKTCMYHRSCVEQVTTYMTQ